MCIVSLQFPISKIKLPQKRRERRQDEAHGREEPERTLTVREDSERARNKVMPSAAAFERVI